MNRFIHKLLQLQTEERGYQNLVFSPLSLEMLLGLVLPGTQGKIREELLQVLEISEEEVNSYLTELQTASESLLAIGSKHTENDNYTKVQLANSLWHQRSVNPNPHYKRTIGTRFPFELFQFSDPLAATNERINQWANEKTNGLIPALPIQLTQDTVAVLLSALYLKGFWSREFCSQSDDIFYTLDGGETSSQYMYLKQDQYGDAKAQYLKKATFHALRLMFNDERIGLEVYLPYENTGLHQFMDNLTPDDFEKWKDEFQDVPFFYFLMPKFEINGNFELNKIAQKLGISNLFDPSQDLAPLLESQLPLNFSEIAQEARLKVTEEGLEAAAVSYTVAVAAGIPQPVNPMLIFEADHPFLYRVVDTITHKSLFQGIFTTPVHASNAFIEHLNNRLYKVYEQKTAHLSNKERLVIALLLVELMLEQFPLQHDLLPQMLDQMWQTLANPSDFSDKQIVEDYHVYYEFLANYAIDPNSEHLKEYKYWGYGEDLNDDQLEALGGLSAMFEIDESISWYNHEEFVFTLTMIVRQDILLPNYEHLEQLIKQHQQDGFVERILLSALHFDEIPTKIT